MQVADRYFGAAVVESASPLVLGSGQGPNFVALGEQSLRHARAASAVLAGGSGHTKASALDVAHTLLAAWGGVRGLARARPEELARTPGVGPAKAARLAASSCSPTRLAIANEAARLVRLADIARVVGRLIGTSRTEQVAVLIARRVAAVTCPRFPGRVLRDYANYAL